MSMTKQTVAALYADRPRAEAAMAALRGIGVPAADLELSPEPSHSFESDEGTPRSRFWDVLERTFEGSDDQTIYRHSVRMGHVLLLAHVDDGLVDEAVRVIDAHGSLDIDEEEAAWRAEHRDVRTDATVPVTDAGMAPLVTPTAPATDEVIQVFEERLDVGKREVSRGKVRIRTSVVTREVAEDVTLHGEHVVVERHAVDRPLSATEADPFRERVIEMVEYDEEAVVSKTARVVEEIAIHKDVTDRTETIHETLRSTKVDVEDGRTVGGVGAVGAGASEGSDRGALAQGMEVIASGGEHVGSVGRVDADGSFLLARIGSASGETQHVSAGMVDHVDAHVHLNHPADEVSSRW